MQVKIQDKATLWHKKLGHLHYGGLKEMSNKGIVHGIPWIFEEIFVRNCLEKANKKFFFKEGNLSCYKASRVGAYGQLWSYHSQVV